MKQNKKAATVLEHDNGNPVKTDQGDIHQDNITFEQAYQEAPAIIQEHIGDLGRWANYTDSMMKDYLHRLVNNYIETLEIRKEMNLYMHGPILISVDGICMEGQDIANGDNLLVDASKRPVNAGDVCIVIAHHPAKIRTGLEPMIKGYIGCDKGGGYWCREYHKERPNCNIFVRPWGFCGVVFACYDADWRLKWARDISDYPEELSRERTLDREPGNLGPMIKISKVTL